jgi:hypothetical protein
LQTVILAINLDAFARRVKNSIDEWEQHLRHGRVLFACGALLCSDSTHDPNSPQNTYQTTNYHVVANECGNEPRVAALSIAATESFAMVRADKFKNLQTALGNGVAERMARGLAEEEDIRKNGIRDDEPTEYYSALLKRCAPKIYAQSRALDEAGVPDDEILIRIRNQSRTMPSTNKKQKPNAQCECQSGKKFKKCCGAAAPTGPTTMSGAIPVPTP